MGHFKPVIELSPLVIRGRTSLFWMLKLRHRASVAHVQDLADAPRGVVDMIIEIIFLAQSLPPSPFSS